jgi:hypothetical protein
VIAFRTVATVFRIEFLCGTGFGPRFALMFGMFRTISTFLALILIFVNVAKAETYSFFSITNNDAGNSALGAGQLTLEVTEYTEGRVLFKFINSGPEAMAITDIYFDDGTLLGIVDLLESGGVDFAVAASPKNLPGWEAYEFRPERNGFYNSFFSLDSEAPIQELGVNPGEWLGVVYALQGSQTFADVLNALAFSQTDIDSDLFGGLRVGIQVQGFGNGGSESFINGPSQGAASPAPVPDSPVTVVLLGLALLGIGIGRRCIA